MTKNMSTLDRKLRTFVAAPLLVVIALLVGAGSLAGIVLLVLAAVMLATSSVSFCPLYAALHLNTRGERKAAHSLKGMTREMDVTTETFQRDVIERSHELPVVVDFWAAWCGPCRMLGPAIETEVAKRAGKIELAKIDVDAEQMLAAQYGIQSIPTVAVFRDGKPVSGFVGAHPAATIGSFLDDTIEKHGEAVDAA